MHSEEDPIKHICRRCGTCCRWPGVVRLLPDEISGMADYLGLAPVDFIAHYTALAPDRRGLILMERDGGACIFLDGNRCRINPVKPQQCRDFPVRWNFAGFEQLCQAQQEAIPVEAPSSATFYNS